MNNPDLSLEDYQQQSPGSALITKILVMTSKIINLTITSSTLIKLAYKESRIYPSGRAV